MAKKTTQIPVDETPVDETKDTEVTANEPVPAEQGGVTAQADQAAEALAQPAETEVEPSARAEPVQAEKAAPATETAAPEETVAPDEDAPEGEAGETDETETLETLDSLALRYRVPSWKQAAMLQMQGWAPGKHVSAAEYEAALADLGTRPLGGGARR